MDGSITALSALVGGWLLNELSHRFRRNAKKRAALGRALAELLEMYHYLKGIEVVFSVFRARLQVSAKEIIEGLDWIYRLLPPDPNLPARSERAVSEIAGINPVLTYRLRSKEYFPLFLAKMRAVKLANNPGPECRLRLDDFLRSSRLLKKD